MKFSTQRETILKPLQLVSGVVERRQTLPILSNVLIQLENNRLTVTATDLEVEVIAHALVDQTIEGTITVPVRKLQDTCRALPDEAPFNFDLNGEKAIIKSGKTRFSLTTLPSDEFPLIDAEAGRFSFSLTQGQMKNLIEKTSFAMATQDVRYYLNGLLLELEDNVVRAVATDGHRLALSSVETETQFDDKTQAIIPRKGVLELLRLLDDNEEQITVTVGDNFLRVELQELVFTTKLVDGKYPNYQAVIPAKGDKIVTAEKAILRQCLLRTAILSNEKYRGIRVEISNNTLRASANNPEQEEAHDEISIDYQGEEIAIGFNVNYLVDAITAVPGEQVCVRFTDANGSALISPVDSDGCLFVVMPMRL